MAARSVHPRLSTWTNVDVRSAVFEQGIGHDGVHIHDVELAARFIHIRIPLHTEREGTYGDSGKDKF